MGAFLFRAVTRGAKRAGPLTRVRREVAGLAGAARATWAFLADPRWAVRGGGTRRPRSPLQLPGQRSQLGRDAQLRQQHVLGVRPAAGAQPLDGAGEIAQAVGAGRRRRRAGGARVARERRHQKYVPERTATPIWRAKRLSSVCARPGGSPGGRVSCTTSPWVPTVPPAASPHFRSVVSLAWD
jgi:hypothetical protein